MSKRLELIFLTDMDKKATIRIVDPKEGLTKNDAFEVMNKIIEKDVFTYGGGRLVEKVCARINSTTELL